MSRAAVALFAVAFAPGFIAAGAAKQSAPSITAVIAEHAGWATAGVVLPAGAARDALRIGSLPTQTDVKVRWPDGSIRHAIVTAKLPAGGSYPVTAAVGTPSVPAAFVPVCSAAITLAGVTHVAVPGGAPASTWLSGSQAAEGRWLVPFGQHPARKLRLDERHYNDGTIKCDLFD